MPRKARIDAPGALHHVIIRGIERRKIFRSDDDRHNFLSRLSELIPETKTACFAWALIPNHAHFLVRTGSDNRGRPCFYAFNWGLDMIDGDYATESEN